MARSHINLPNNQLHNPKGFSTALTNTTVQKDVDGNLSWDACPVFCFRVVIPSADVLTLNSSAVTLVNDVSGYGVRLLSAEAKLDKDSGSSAYNTNTTIQIGTTFTPGHQAENTSTLLDSGGVVYSFDMQGSASRITSSELRCTVTSGNPMGGDTDLVISGTYRLILL